MISAILYQLTRNLSIHEIKKSGFDTYFVDHTTGVYPQAASGAAFSASTLQVTGDTLADLYEDLAAEQKARLSYDNILRLIDDPEVRDPIKFLREREIVHFQRFGDALRITQDHLNSKNFYAFNPSFDTQCNPREHRPIGAAPNCRCTAPIGERTDSCGCERPEPTPSCGCEHPEPMPPSGCGCDCAPAEPTPEPMPYCGCAAQQASEQQPPRSSGCRPPVMPAGCPTMQSNCRRRQPSCGNCSCG